MALNTQKQNDPNEILSKVALCDSLVFRPSVLVGYSDLELLYILQESKQTKMENILNQVKTNDITNINIERLENELASRKVATNIKRKLKFGHLFSDR